MKLFKSITALFLVVAMLAAITGCGGTASESSVAPESEPASASESVSSEAPAEGPSMEFPTEDVTLTYIWWGSQVRHERTQQIVDLFCQEHPNVTIETEYSSSNGYQDKLLTLMAAGSTPSMFQTEYEYIPQWVEGDYVQSFTPYIEAGVMDISDCTSLDACYYGEDLYAQNLGLNGPSIMYDRGLLKSIGIELDESSPWTWDQFLETGRQVYEKTGVKTSFYIIFRMTDWLRCSARNAGQQLFVDSSALGITDTSLIKRSFDVVQTAYDEGFGVDGAYYAGYSSVEQQALVDGTSWNACMTSNLITGLVGAMTEEKDIGYMMIPDFADATAAGQYLKPSQVMCIGNDSTDAQKVVAATFINWMITSMEANEILLAERGVPCCTSVREGLADKVDDTTKKQFNFIATASKYAGPLDVANVTWLSEINEASSTIEQNIWYGEYDAQAATDEFIRKCNELISEAK